MAKLLIARHLLPRQALVDARHVAVASVAQVDFLVTWNCTHIANSDRLPHIYATLRSEGYNPPRIVTPEEYFDVE